MSYNQFSNSDYNNKGDSYPNTDPYTSSRQSASVAPTNSQYTYGDSTNVIENPPKPDSYSYGVQVEKHEEPVKEEVLYSEEDEWQPSFMMICFIFWIVLVVAGCVGVGAYFGWKNRGKGTEGPTFAPSAFPTVSPSAVPPELICNVCGDNDPDGVTSPLTVVDIVGLSNLPEFSGDDITCRRLQEGGEAGNVPRDVCDTEVQIRSVQEQCGCSLPPTPAPSISEKPTNSDIDTPAPNFVCPICGGEDFGISNPTGVVQLPGSAETTTCAELEEEAQNGQIDPTTCFAGALNTAVQANCDCVFQCNLCGTQPDGTATGVISNPQGIVELPLGQPNRTCASLIAASEAGTITESQCTVLQPFVVTPCECVFSNNVL
ncbi:MAG: hypothetical protein SGARI_004351 [Bacillariaceae sp.]